MRDGAVLRADVYQPASGGPWPVLLVRTPYDKQDPDILGVLDPLAAVRRGFMVVIQDVRGRFRSEGDWEPMVHERDDGFDAVRWAARLPGSSGRVGMYGPSYLGHAQWAAMSATPRELLVAAPAFTWSDPYDGLVARGGACELGLVTQWSETLDSDVPRRPEEGRPIATLPTFTVAGWYDAFLQGSLDNYIDARARGQPTQLVVGPWSHNDQSGRIGRLDFGAAADSSSLDGSGSLRSRELDWLERYLMPHRPPRSAEPPILVFVMGVNQWRRLDEWPPAAKETSWYLRADGCLSVRPPGAHEPPDTFSFDPADPVPTLGGAILLTPDFPAGPLDQREIEDRPDVLVYTGEPLSVPLEVVGRVRVHVVAVSSAPSTDWVARLCDVDADGVSVNIVDGVLRVDDADPCPREHVIDLWSTAHVFLPGHRVRVQITSSSFPRWDRNLRGEQTIYHDAARPSRIVLPLTADSPPTDQGAMHE
jgi:predicted acyl esterase